jgi:hypothetical protein
MKTSRLAAQIVEMLAKPRWNRWGRFDLHRARDAARTGHQMPDSGSLTSPRARRGGEINPNYTVQGKLLKDAVYGRWVITLK